MKSNHVPGSVMFRGSTQKFIGRRRWKDSKGKQVEKSFTCDSEKEAWKELEKLDKELLKGTFVVKDMTFGQWLDEAMETIFKPKLRSSTYGLYQFFIDNFLTDLKQVPLNKLTVDMIEEVWSKKRTKPLSRNTKCNIRRFIINVLNHAVRKDRVSSNVALKTVITDAAPRRVIKALKSEQVKKLLSKTDDSLYRTLFATQILLGLRIGEVLALKWSGFDGKVVHVHAQIQRDRVSKKIVEQDLKTTRSKRTVPVSDSLAKMLEQLPKNGDYIFANKKGGPLEPRNVQRVLSKAAESAGLGNIGTHVLRHTYATLNVQLGTDINVISNALGHTDLRTTMIYADAEVETIREANDKLAELIA